MLCSQFHSNLKCLALTKCNTVLTISKSREITKCLVKFVWIFLFKVNICLEALHWVRENSYHLVRQGVITFTRTKITLLKRKLNCAINAWKISDFLISNSILISLLVGNNSYCLWWHFNCRLLIYLVPKIFISIFTLDCSGCSIICLNPCLSPVFSYIVISYLAKLCDLFIVITVGKKSNHKFLNKWNSIF